MKRIHFFIVGIMFIIMISGSNIYVNKEKIETYKIRTEARTFLEKTYNIKEEVKVYNETDSKTVNTLAVSNTSIATYEAVDGSLSEYSKEVLRLINEERAKAGIAPLRANNIALNKAANIRAKEIVELPSHTRPNGELCFSILMEFGIGYNYASENVAGCIATPAEVVSAWMASPGHRENIMNPKFTQVGLGFYESDHYYYWSQLFID